MNEKQCVRCGSRRPADAFHRATANPDGRARWCKECHNAHKRGVRSGAIPLRGPAVPAVDLFWTKVLKADGDACWEWTASYGDNGYGLFQQTKNGRKRATNAHRFAWILTNGPIPAGLFVCHHCDNRRCVRPDHMFLGTHTDNMRDMARKHRGNPQRKLTDEQVRQIRAQRADGVPLKEIAKRFGVCRGTVSYVTVMGGWSHIANDVALARKLGKG